MIALLLLVTGRALLLSLVCPAAGGLMWRTAKQDVVQEIGLPPQHTHQTHLRLSDIERHWYNRAHADCAATAQKYLPAQVMSSAAVACTQGDAALVESSPNVHHQHQQQQLQDVQEELKRPLTHTEQKRLLQPLLRLRQACCHPQVGGGGLRAGGAGGNAARSAPMTMSEVSTALIAKARIEAEEAQRILIGALNGLAALMIVDRKYVDAVKTYRQALAVSEANKGEVRTDPLQMLHTLHNLGELLHKLQHAADEQGGNNKGVIDNTPNQGGVQPQRQTVRSLMGLPDSKQGEMSSNRRGNVGAAANVMAGVSIPRTLRDEALRSEADVIRQQYLAQRQAKLAQDADAYQ